VPEFCLIHLAFAVWKQAKQTIKTKICLTELINIIPKFNRPSAKQAKQKRATGSEKLLKFDQPPTAAFPFYFVISN